MDTNELDYIDKYSAAYLREILKEYGVRVPSSTKKPQLVARLKSCMRLQIAMSRRGGKQ